MASPESDLVSTGPGPTPEPLWQRGIRLIAAAIFLVGGLNGFFSFLPATNVPPFMDIMMDSGYIYIVKAIEITGALLLIYRPTAPLGTILLAPIAVNIVAFHALIDPTGAALGVTAAVLIAALLFIHRRTFSGIFVFRQ